MSVIKQSISSAGLNQVPVITDTSNFFGGSRGRYDPTTVSFNPPDGNLVQKDETSSPDYKPFNFDIPRIGLLPGGGSFRLPHNPISSSPSPFASVNPQATKAEPQQSSKTTSPTTSAGQVQAVKNMLATHMANDIEESPQKAIDKGAVSKEGKVTPNKLEPAVQEELKQLITDFQKHSKDFSKQINELAEKINKEHDSKFKSAYNDFKEKYNNNFGEGKDLMKDGFNAKEVVDSFDKAFDASKDTDEATQKEMKDIKENIIDKYIRPMDNLARGDQGTAKVGRDKLLDSASKSVDGLKNDKLSTAFDKFKNTIAERGDIKQASQDLKTQISNLKNDTKLTPEQSAELDKIDKATSTAGQLHQIIYAGVKEESGKAVLDNDKLDFDHKQTSEDFFDYMQQNHREDIKPTLDQMNEQSGNLTPEETKKAGINIEYKNSDIKTFETPDKNIGKETERNDSTPKLADADTIFDDDQEDLIALEQIEKPEIPDEDDDTEIA
jgi:hypothetical protein